MRTAGTHSGVTPLWQVVASELIVAHTRCGVSADVLEATPLFAVAQSARLPGLTGAAERCAPRGAPPPAAAAASTEPPLSLPRGVLADPAALGRALREHAGAHGVARWAEGLTQKIMSAREKKV